MAKKKVNKDPNQGSFLEKITTSSECREAKGSSWKADSALGSKDGKNLGRCFKATGWIENLEGDQENA